MALDFPSNPSDGQTYNNYIWSSSTGAWRSLNSIYASNALKNSTISTGSASTVPLTIQGYTSQSANLQEWKNDGGNSLSIIDPAGKAIFQTGANAINIKASSTVNHGYMSFYTENTTPTTRTGYIGFGSNGTSTMTIANEISSGTISLNSSYVKMPNQPTFFAYQPESGTYMIGAGIPVFSSVLVNATSSYNTSNGRFTAPTSGTYQFNAMMLIRTNTSAGEMTFLKNGANVVSRNLAYSNPVGTSAHDPVHISVYLVLAAGDYIQVSVSQPSGGDWYYGGGLGWFSGTLIG